MRLLILFSTLFLFSSTRSQNIKISVFTHKEINALTVHIKQGKYLLKSGDETLGEYKKGNIFHISRFGNTLQVRDKRSLVGNFSQIGFTCAAKNGIVSVKPVNPVLTGRDYDDDFMFSAGKRGIQLINKTDMEKYIAAVIVAEGGNHAPKEYYMAQAALIRTYTIKNMYKHAEEGFNLCDQVHCQAFHGNSIKNHAIRQAVRSTAGKILINKDTVVVMSPFHSNCGGVTSAAGMAWQKNLPHLTSIKDPFCTKSKNNLWTQSIPREEWIQFITNYTTDNIDYKSFNFSFNVPNRTKFVLIHGIELNLRTVREHFGLKSAFFSMQDTKNEVLITGKGYGHGVGLCQEGAMEMARVGYTWLDIIHFYFKEVQIADYRELEISRY